MNDLLYKKEPLIGEPLKAPRPRVIVRYSDIVLSKIMKRIQSPSQSDYQAIESLQPGSYICTVDNQCGNAGITIDVYKKK